MFVSQPRAIPRVKLNVAIQGNITPCMMSPPFVIYNPVKHKGIIPVYTPYPPTLLREELTRGNPPPSKIQHFPSILENPDIGLSVYSSPGCV